MPSSREQTGTPSSERSTTKVCGLKAVPACRARVWESNTFLSGLLSLKTWFCFGTVWEEIFSSLT